LEFSPDDLEVVALRQKREVAAKPLAEGEGDFHYVGFVHGRQRLLRTPIQVSPLKNFCVHLTKCAPSGYVFDSSKGGYKENSS
jgi:hypothetical protein